jgi:hypothetical protein
VRTLHLVPQGRLKVAQDVVLGSDKQAGQSREGRLNIGAEFSAVPAGLSAEFSRRLFSPFSEGTQGIKRFRVCLKLVNR